MSTSNSKNFLRSVPGILLIFFIIALTVTAGLLVYLLTFNEGESDYVDRNAPTSIEEDLDEENTQEETDLEEIDASANDFTDEDLELLQGLEEDLRP